MKAFLIKNYDPAAQRELEFLSKDSSLASASEWEGHKIFITGTSKIEI